MVEKIFKSLAPAAAILLLTSCADADLNLGIGTGWGFGRSGIGIGLGTSVPLGKVGEVFDSSAENKQSANDNDAKQRPGLEAINRLRRQKGLPELKNNASLEAFAVIRARELTVKYGHVRPDGRNAMDQIRGNAFYVELIGQTPSFSTDDILEYWQKKSDRLGDAQFTAAGFGAHVAFDGTTSWVLILGDEKAFAAY